MYLVEIYQGMFRYQVSIGLLPLILISWQMRLSCKGLNSRMVYLVEIYQGMFRYQVSTGLLPFILIILANEVDV